jgi:hypothetical protein
VLGGSTACWIRGAATTAADLDFMIKPEDAERALTALVGAGMREERPPEQWLLKAWDGTTLVDLIFEPSGMEVDDEVIARGERLSISGMWISVMSLDDVLITKLMTLGERSLDYEPLLQIARSLRERIDWRKIRARTEVSPYARSFFSLLEELGVTERGEGREGARPRIRAA